MFFDDWHALVRSLVGGCVAYVGLIIVLRVCGKRTLSKWNAFDFVVTIALGSVLATTILSKDVRLVQGLGALVILVGLQFIVTWLSVRFPAISALVKARPALLLSDGRFQGRAMRESRVTEGEVRAAVRGHGFSSLAEVAAVVLETDGGFSVIRKIGESDASALADVDGCETADR